MHDSKSTESGSVTDSQKQTGGNSRTVVLIMLVLVYTFNFIDRQIIGILAVPIKADLHLTDTQLGLMGGLAFALFYTSLGIPIAWLADRKSRTWIMTGALVVWSAMTAACGLVTNFTQLFLARLGVGVGEAGGVAPAYSLIADYFPQEQRARALSAYSFGIPIGSAIGIVFGGVVATLIDWRTAFIAVGLMGILIAPLFRLIVKEPKRGQYDGKLATTEAASILDVLKVLSKKPAFWLLAVGASCSSMMGYGLFFWLPSFFVRTYHLTLLHASLTFGAILLVGGLVGIWMGGWLADRSARAGKKTGYALIPATAFVLTVPFFLGGILAPSYAMAMTVLLVPVALGLMWLGPVLSAVQHLVAPNMRSTASAIFLFINNLIGIGAGTALLGMLSDGLRAQFGDDALRYSILAGTSFYIAAAVLFWLASKTLDRDWVRGE
ncbi:spinster family MFS transporter [Kordiimonas marina]|uniref:spinster family MFS transporter n=1 Tax=Kordiimonas marina TaxID=2872312 RepID=UPI001FF1A86E|nr:MFS transporter [Kordiimonas marina]MCJ9430140.1 MFS transporter [Kordiimonas marina]